MKILILTGSPNSYSTNRLKEEAEKRGHTVTIENPVNLMAYISPLSSGYDRAYKKSKQGEDVKRVKGVEYDVIIPRFAGSDIFEFGCAILEHLNGNMNIPSTSWAMGLRIASSKFLSCQAFSQAKVRTPKSLFSYKPNDFGFIVETLGLPIICKTLSGSQGAGVFIMNDYLSISTTLGAFSKLGVNLLLQEFIDSGKPANDLRIIVVNGKVSAAYRRFSVDSDFRSNYSLSKSGEKVELTKELEKLAINAANSVGLDVCGVDIMEDAADKKRPYVIEINGNMSLNGAEKISEKNIAKDIILYAETIGKGSARKKENDKEAKSMIMQKPEFSTTDIIRQEPRATVKMANGRKAAIIFRPVLVKKCPLFT